MLDQTSSLTDADILDMATAFDVFIEGKTFIRVEARYPSEGGKVWAIVNESKFVLNVHGGWEYEPPMPAGRDIDFVARTRWDDLRAAIRAALEAIGSGI